MSKKASKNIIILDKPKVIDVEQQLLVSERDDLLEAETAYKRRIEQLEQEAADMLRSFDILYNENKLLRSKLDLPDGAGAEKVESYNSVFKEREHFREANRAFKRRIKQLEDDADDNKKSYEELEVKYKLLTQKAQLQTEYATKFKDEKIGELVEEQDELNKKVAMFIKEREQYEERITLMTKKETELQNKCDILETDRHELKLRCDILQSDREKLKEKVTDLEAKIPDPEIKAKEEQQYLGLQAQVAALQVANKDGTYEIHKLKEEIRILHKTTKEKVETLDKASSALDIFEAEIKEQQVADAEKIVDLQNEVDQSKNLAMTILKENDKLKSDNAIAESQIANMNLELKQLQDEIKSKQEAIDEMSFKVRSGQSLNDDYLVMESKLKDLIADKQALENELIQERKVHKLKLTELNNDISKTADALKQKQNAYSRCEQEAKKLHHENDSLQKVVDAQAIELRNMKSQLEQIQNLLEERSNKYEEMKKAEKEAIEEMNAGRLELHTVKRQLEDLRDEKRGSFGILRKEMQTVKDQRTEETEKLRKETIQLKAEVKNLKESEHKISIMEAEINRLLLRLKRTEKFRKIPTKAAGSNNKTDATITVDREEMMQLRRKHRELEKEKMVLLQEKKQWEIMKEKYIELQQTAKRLNHENKRVRGNLDGTESKVELLEKRVKMLNPNLETIPEKNSIQTATYVDKTVPERRKHALVKKTPQILSKIQPAVQNPSPEVKQPTGRKLKSIIKSGKKSEKKTVDSNPHLRHKKATLPQVHDTTVGLQFGKSYKDIHKNRYKPTSFTLGLL